MTLTPQRRATISPMRATFPFILSLTLLAGCGSASEPPAPASPPAVNPTPPASPRPPSATPPSGTPSAATPAASATAIGARTTGTPAAATTPTLGPLALNEVQAAWTARGLTVATGESPNATGFSVTPNPVKLTKGPDATELLVFTYPSQGALDQDWVVGAAMPAPKEGKSAGSFTSAWWNQNVVVVVRARSAATDEARDAFLALGNVAAVMPAGSPSPAASGTVPAGSPVAGTPPAGSPSPTPAARTPTATATRPAVIPTTSTPR